MTVNPSLPLVSGVFFVTLSAALSVVAWAAAEAALRMGRARLLPAQAKAVLLGALSLPPLLALAVTAGGALLHHSHATPLLEHHNALCRAVFGTLLGPGQSGGRLMDAADMGPVVNGLAWLLLGFGAAGVARLVGERVRLAQTLAPLLCPPSARLARALAEVGTRTAVQSGQFFECALPPACTGVVGPGRCVVSQALVASASDAELRAVVAHEAAHLRDGDAHAAFWVGMLSKMFFYLRPVQALAQRWREQSEMACDAAAVQATGDMLALAAAILRVSRAVSGAHARPLPQETGLVGGDGSLTARRVERLLAREQMAATAAQTHWQAAGGWAATLAVLGVGVWAMLSPQAACWAHCSLETVARLLP